MCNSGAEEIGDASDVISKGVDMLGVCSTDFSSSAYSFEDWEGYIGSSPLHVKTPTTTYRCVGLDRVVTDGQFEAGSMTGRRGF
jgi:hypothetical protein